MMHHVSIRTRDLARAESFYGRLGFLLESRYTNGNQQPVCWLSGPHGRLELVEVQSDRLPPDSTSDLGYVGYDHVALVVDGLDGVLSTLAAAGTEQLRPAAQRMMNGRGYRIAFVRDLDGLLIELIEETSPV